MIEMKEYVRDFIMDEEGAETFEFVLILGIVAGLAVIVGVIVAIVRSKMEDTADAIEDLPGADGVTTSVTEPTIPTT